MARHLDKALLEQDDDGESLKDVWTAFRRKELEMAGQGVGNGVAASKFVAPQAPDVEKRQVTSERIGGGVLKILYTVHKGGRKRATEIEVGKAELDKLIEERAGAAHLLLSLRGGWMSTNRNHY